MYHSRDTSSSDQRFTGGEDNTYQNIEVDLRENKRKLQFLIMTCCFGSLNIGYSLTISNICFQIINNNVEDKPSTIGDTFFYSLYTSMVPLGATFGCLVVVSKVFQIGRRLVLIFADLLAVVGCLFCCFKDFYIIIIGMFIIGLSVGINTIMIPTYLMEYAPSFYGKGRVIITHHLFLIIGIAASFLWGVGFKEELADNAPPPPLPSLLSQPNDNGKFSIENSRAFQVIVYIIPLFFASLRTVLLVFYYKKDTPFYYLLKNQKEKARKIISVYYKEEQGEKLLELFEIKQARQMEGSTKLIDMLQLRYRSRVGISCIMNFFCYFGGVFFILFYSYQSLDTLDEDDHQYHMGNSIRTLIIGVVLFVTQMFQMVVSQFMGRKMILLIGQAFYIVGFIGMTSVVQVDFDSKLNVITIFMCLVSVGFCFQSSVIPVILNEILPERGVAAAHCISIFSILIGAFIYPFLCKSDEIQFIYYICQLMVNIIGFFLLHRFVKETRGLTNFQIEKLYTQNFHGLVKEPEDSDGDISRNLIAYSS